MLDFKEIVKGEYWGDRQSFLCRYEYEKAIRKMPSNKIPRDLTYTRDIIAKLSQLVDVNFYHLFYFKKKVD